MTEKFEKDHQVVGPTIELAAKVKAALERENLDVEKPWGVFYVKSVELGYCYGGDSEVVGYLTPDEGDGKSFDFYTAKRVSDD